MPFISRRVAPGQARPRRRASHERGGAHPARRRIRIAYAHENGVMHRDVKPDNVLLSGGVAVVTDFGVAKAVSVSTAAGAPSVTGLTSFGMALGTPNYMAPEQASGDPQIDHRVDIYALGMMSYEMLAGRTPFWGRSTQAVLAAHVVEMPEAIERLRPSLPPPLARSSCTASRSGRPIGRSPRRRSCRRSTPLVRRRAAPRRPPSSRGRRRMPPPPSLPALARWAPSPLASAARDRASPSCGGVARTAIAGGARRPPTPASPRRRTEVGGFRRRIPRSLRSSLYRRRPRPNESRPRQERRHPAGGASAYREKPGGARPALQPEPSRPAPDSAPPTCPAPPGPPAAAEADTVTPPPAPQPLPAPPAAASPRLPRLLRRTPAPPPPPRDAAPR